MTPPELEDRLAVVTLRDERRLRRDLRGRARSSLDEELARAEARVARRRAQVPRVTYPEQLPVSGRIDDLAAALRDSQVVVVAGETGSGKTTQLPKLCLQMGRGVRGTIAHTQPRRIAARAVAERLAEELAVPLGEVVGYQVRFTRQTSANTLVKVMTDGVLLAEIARDPDLLAYDTVIVDEAHERSLTIDFLLGYLVRLLPRRPDLRVIVTSATIDPQRFADHFAAANRRPVPVVEVSGRTYPVEVRHRPFGGDLDDRDQVQAVLEAVTELSGEGHGDVLVFLSGEREIRDTADALRRLDLRGTEVLPLYGRLSSAEQHRVFESRAGTRRVVLATNVAETSLTVPGIRYVVDTGTARISRYSTRLKVQRLPIEKVSRASAQQRAGRCGRVADGICIRLYDEDDFDARPSYTDPEILRTNLAAVILHMAALDLGPLEDFPFLDPPDRRAVRDGVALLEELGALQPGTRRLTALGRRLARLPLDPRLARMVLAASDLSCVLDVLVVTAALTIQDPRERPADAQEQADAAHRRFADASSDVVALLNLWRYVEEQQQALSSSAFRRLCRADHLHYLRIREWQDLVAQLREVVTHDLDLTVGATWAHPDHVHRALLSGLLSHVGLKEAEGRDYLAARGARFVLWPGSALAKKPPRWVMAAELVETSRLFARTAARVDPQWVEQAGAHLLVRTYSEPHWDRKRAAVMAFERATLYGVPIVPRRRVTYSSVDPRVSRELFIRHALVDGEWDAHHDFLRHNADALQAARSLEDKLRRRVLVDEETVFAFYDERVPAEVVSGRHFDMWWKRARRADPRLLDLSAEELAPEVVGDEFPEALVVGQVRVPLTYRFAPDEPDDGVTASLPLAALEAVPAPALSWLVPGLRHERAVALVRSLPKEVRRLLVPAPDTATAALEQMTYDERVPFETALAAALRRVAAVDLAPTALPVDRLPPHLRMHVAVRAPDGSALAVGDDLDELRIRLAPALRRAVADLAPTLQQSGLTRWPGGEIPRTLDVRRDGVTIAGYPSLLDEGGTVGVRVLPSSAEQAVAMAQGVRRLLLLAVPSPARSLLAALSPKDKLALARDTDGRAAEAVRDAIAAAVDALVGAHGGPPWQEAQWDALRSAVEARLPAEAARVLRHAMRLHAIARDLRERLRDTPTPALEPSYGDLRGQLRDLTPPDVATTVGATRLGDVARYLEAMRIRLDRLPQNLSRDLELMDRVHAVEDAWHDAVDSLPASAPLPADLGVVRWMLEELRVSLFAQQLGTPHPVSEKRILQALHARRA